MNSLPPPLTPLDCDLTDFSFMPLDVRRLRDSDLAALETPEACWAAVLLWCASWHQVPAASLPDDDRVLSNLAGYGRVIKEWQRIKEGALRGWVKCSDGRLYHPTVAGKALESWKSKVKYAYDKLADRTRKAAGKREKDGLPPVEILTLDEWISIGRPEHFPEPSPFIPPETPKPSAGKSKNSTGKESEPSGNPQENALKGQGEGQGYIKDKAAAANISNIVDPVDNSPPPESLDFETEGKIQIAMTTRFAQLIREWEKARGKASKITSSDPRLSVWCAKRVAETQLREAYDLAVADRDHKQDITPINAGFLDTFLAKILNPPEGQSALDRAALPASAKPWAASWSGIEAKGAEFGLVQQQGEQPHQFRARVFAAANFTEIEKARLRIDWGVQV